MFRGLNKVKQLVYMAFHIDMIIQLHRARGVNTRTNGESIIRYKT